MQIHDYQNDVPPNSILAKLTRSLAGVTGSVGSSATWGIRGPSGLVLWTTTLLRTACTQKHCKTLKLVGTLVTLVECQRRATRMTSSEEVLRLLRPLLRKCIEKHVQDRSPLALDLMHCCVHKSKRPVFTAFTQPQLTQNLSHQDRSEPI